MLFSDFKEIKEVYCKLEESGRFPKNENKVKYEKDFYSFLCDLYENKHIREDRYAELNDKIAAATLSEELKGFTSGIYFILKLKDEMGQDFENILKSFKL